MEVVPYDYASYHDYNDQRKLEGYNKKVVERTQLRKLRGRCATHCERQTCRNAVLEETKAMKSSITRMPATEELLAKSPQKLPLTDRLK